MLFAVLLGCVRLQEGDYEVDYAPVSEDSCGIYDGAEGAPDATGTLAWEDDTLVFAFDGEDDDLVFDVSGTTFSRDEEGAVALDDTGACFFATERTDAGRMLSNTTFEGESSLVAVLQGSCTVQQQVFDDPCTVAFSWEGARVE